MLQSRWQLDMAKALSANPMVERPKSKRGIEAGEEEDGALNDMATLGIPIERVSG